MKKLRNMLCSGIASAMLLSALPVHAANMVTTTDGHGESETVEETVRFINEHNDWGIVKANGSVQVGSQTVDLLVTFQSPEAAMANFKNKCEYPSEGLNYNSDINNVRMWIILFLY